MNWEEGRGLGLGLSKWPDAIWSLTENLLAIMPKGGYLYKFWGLYTMVLILVGERWYRDLHSKVRVSMDGGWMKGENTEFVCKILGLKSRSKWKDFYTRNVALFVKYLV